MNMEAAIAKLLRGEIIIKYGYHQYETYLWDLLRRNAQPRRNATNIDTDVTSTKKIGTIHNSRSFSAAKDR